MLYLPLLYDYSKLCHYSKSLSRWWKRLRDWHDLYPSQCLWLMVSDQLGWWRGKILGRRGRSIIGRTLCYNIAFYVTYSECHSDGTHTCFFDFTLDANGQLSAEQVETLKSNLLKVFKLKHNSEEEVKIKAQQIHETDPVVQGIHTRLHDIRVCALVLLATCCIITRAILI